MSSRKKPRFIVPTLLALCLLQAGCGWQPIYGSHDSNVVVASSLNQVGIDNIPERQGQMLRNNLIDRMYGKGRPQHPTYRLSINLHSSQQDVGILSDSTSTRTQVDMYADYVLKDAKGTVLMTATAHSVTSFSRLNQQYATLAGQEDAISRTVGEVSEQIVNRVSLYFANPSAPPAPDVKPTDVKPATGNPQSIFN